MASKIKMPIDPNMDLNAYAAKYLNDDEYTLGNPIQLFNIESPYYEIEQLSAKLNIELHKKDTFEYTSMHLNIQSLPAKFDKLKLLISELQEQDIHLDFILLCETFLNDNIANQFNIKGYNLVYKNRTKSTRGGVAIYANTKYNFAVRDDLALNTPGVFESVFIEIQSNKCNVIVGEIYRVPNTNELKSIKMYETISKQLQNYNHNIIIGTDQNFDYIKIDQHKNSEDLLSNFLANGLVPTITKPTRITHSTATLIDNLYISVKN
jgi:hypothetical protein